MKLAIMTVDAIATANAAFEKGQAHIDRCYADQVKPFLADCAEDAGFPPLTDLIHFLRSDEGKQLIANGISLVRTVVLVIAFLAIASVMGIAMTCAKIADWCYALWLAKGQAILDGKYATYRMIRSPKAVKRLYSRKLMLKAKEVAKMAITHIDQASGVTEPTFA